MIPPALIRHRRPLIFLTVGILHLLAFIYIRFAMPVPEQQVKEDYTILKLVDVEEYIPPPPQDTPVTTVHTQETSSERIIETENEVVEVPADYPITVDPPVAAEPEYLPQHKVSNIPEIPTKEILSRIEYPPIAMRQGIEGVVYLELYIDQTGDIRKILVLKDPGFGFADAAVKSLQGIRCTPALANGVPVAVKFRYPVRFTLQ